MSEHEPSEAPKQELPGKGLFGWLGRQIGYVSSAIKTDPAVVARKESVEEKRDPDHPDLVFRRTTVDEVRRDLPQIGQQHATPNQNDPPNSADRE